MEPRIDPCPECRASLEGRPEVCPNCHVWLGAYWIAPKPPPRPKDRVPWRYDLASVMIFIVVFAVGLGLSLQLATAGIGVPILILGPATVLRMAPILVNRRREGEADREPGLVALILESVLVVGTLWLAGSIAFVTVCFPIGLMTFKLGEAPYLWTAFAGGGLAACLVLYRIGRRTFPPRD